MTLALYALAGLGALVAVFVFACLVVGARADENSPQP